jgi:hypothetical protein
MSPSVSVPFDALDEALANNQSNPRVTVPCVTPVTAFARSAVYTVRIGLRIDCDGGFDERSANLDDGAFLGARHGPRHFIQPSDLA